MSAFVEQTKSDELCFVERAPLKSPSISGWHFLVRLMAAFVRLLTTKNPVSDEPVAKVWVVNVKWSEMCTWAGEKLPGSVDDAEEDVAVHSTEARSPAGGRGCPLCAGSVGDGLQRGRPLDISSSRTSIASVGTSMARSSRSCLISITNVKNGRHATSRWASRTTSTRSESRKGLSSSLVGETRCRWSTLPSSPRHSSS